MRLEFNDLITRALDDASERMTEGAYLEFSLTLKKLHHINKKAFEMFLESVDEKEVLLRHYMQNYQRMTDMYDDLKADVDQMKEALDSAKRVTGGFSFFKFFAKKGLK